MEKSNEEKDLYAFSWPVFLSVTGISLFIFSFVLRIIDGRHTSLFLYAGTASLFIAFMAWLLTRRV